MKATLLALVPATLLLMPFGPQELAVLCPATATATGGGYYRVMSDGVLVSQHTRLDQAVVSAIREETANTNHDVVIDHDFRLRVECPTDWGAPAEPDPDAVATLLIHRDGQVVACGGDCSAYPGVEPLELVPTPTQED